MKINAESSVYHLPRGGSLKLDDAERTVIACRSGQLWITEEHCSADIVLGPGESFVVDRPGVTLLNVCNDAVFHLRQGRPVPLPTAAERLQTWLHDCLHALHPGAAA